MSILDLFLTLLAAVLCAFSVYAGSAKHIFLWLAFLVVWFSPRLLILLLSRR
jgi:hypothetical protein